MAAPVNTQQDFVSLRLRLQEAYDQLSNLPVGEAHRPKKFKTLQSITDGLKTLERLKAGFTVIVIPPPPSDEPKQFVAWHMDREEIAQEINFSLDPEQLLLHPEMLLTPDDPRLTDEICEDYAELYGAWMGATAEEWGSVPDLTKLNEEFIKKIFNKEG